LESGIVFVDSYTCEPFAQERVLLAVEHAYRSIVAGAPGFLGAAVLTGRDRATVTVVARFVDDDALLRLRALPAFHQVVAELEQISSGHDPRVHRATAWVEARADSDPAS
jgi:Antibiotic biosynthesis monooxygenase